MTTRVEIQRLVRTGLYDPNLTEMVISKVESAVDTLSPLLLDGQAGCGKTAGVYYVALRRNIRVIEFNASDDLRTKENMRRLRNKFLTAHEETWIILIDEVDKKSNLKLLAELVYLNKMSSSNTVLIAITNYGWQLKKRFPILDTKMSFIDAFGANYYKVYRPYSNMVVKSLGKRKIRVPGSVKVSTDLRDYEKIVKIRDYESDTPVEFKNAFWLFSEYMGKPIYKRKEVPTAKQLGGGLDKWIIKNGLSNNSGFSLRWWKADFQDALELLSLAKLYGNDNLLLFISSFWMQKGSYAHPNSI